MDMFEKAFLDMGAGGIFQKIQSLSIPKPKVYKPKDNLEPLSLEHFGLAGIFLAIGMTMATSVFIWEVNNRKRIDRKITLYLEHSITSFRHIFEKRMLKSNVTEEILN